MKLHFERVGEGLPAYFFLHGFLGNLDNWRTIARTLQLRGSLYLIDARNHGLSPHTPIHNYPAMAADLVELMESERLPQAHILGHSMGGKTGMYMALHYPQKVASLVVVDISPKAYTGGHEIILQTLQKVNLAVGRREEVESQLISAIPDIGTRQFLLKSLVRGADGQFTWRWNLSVLIQAYPAILEAIDGPIPYKGPVLFIKGERSPYIQPADETAIHRLFPSAQILTIAHAGHWIHVDNPSELIQVLRRFWGEGLSLSPQ
ncbi:MAG: alpha/beta fold hydrolase [Bacteroidia bacterium]|nr:alpha/beta fold hydrolase [Bacteroidia bacterium]